MELVPAARTAPPHCPATIAAAFKGNLRSSRFITFVITTTTVDTGLQKGDRLISTCKMLSKSLGNLPSPERCDAKGWRRDMLLARAENVEEKFEKCHHFLKILNAVVIVAH